MRTSTAVRWYGGTAVWALAIGAAPLAAQDPLTGVNSGTEVRSIAFRFRETETIELSDLKAQLATTARGTFYGLFKALAWLPAVPAPGAHPFDPLTLQRDVVRLRELYQRAGFLKAQIEYEVSYNEDDNLVKIEFVVREGPQLAISELRFAGVDGSPPLLAPELVDDWDKVVAFHQSRAIHWSEAWQRQLDDTTARWLRNRGYPFATVETEITADTTVMTAVATMLVRPGSRDRIREIVVTGNESVPAEHLARQLPLEPGDWYDAGLLEKGRAQLMQQELMRLVSVQVQREEARDSTVVVQMQVSENKRRVIRGELGVISGGGIGGQADWTHRSFLGGLRSLTLATSAQTGVLPLGDPPREEYRVSLSVFEPYVGDRRLSLGYGPFAEFRDDVRDKSWEVGFQSALVWSTGPVRSLSLGYTFSHQQILEFGFGDIAPADFLPLLGLAPPGSVGPPPDRVDQSLIVLSGSWGRLDRFANPRKGFVIRPRFAVTTPFYNTSEYVLFEVGGSWFLPVKRRAGATVRFDAGRVFPYGKSVEGNTDPFVALLRLHDATFTAGGSRDVRGWGTDMLGPTLPSVTPVLTDSGTTVYTADEYAPMGGLARLVGSAQINLPLPGFGDKLHSFFFIDGARIWTPDDRFRIDNEEVVQDKFYVGTGGGVGYETLVGAVTVAVGYKVNPSALDMRDPGAVMAALQNGQPISSVPEDPLRRWQIHFAIGATF